jgi:RecA/RadA recombinase
VVPAAQEDDPETNVNALRASLYSNQLPLIKSRLSAKRCVWIDTNQIRTNPRSSFGNPEYEMCGEAVKTLSDVRVKAKKAIPPKGRGRPERKNYIEEEPSWDKTGIDRYNFAHLSVVKNKAFSPNRECDVRVWFESNGEPGRGIDPVYDCYEYLRLTGQIQYRARQFTIALEPFGQERKVKVPQIDPKTKEHVYDQKTGEVLMMEDKRSTWTWDELKELILGGQGLRGAWNLLNACRKQIDDGTAFRLYFETQTAAIMKQQAGATEE